MPSLILHPTSTAQWHALLMEAQQSSAIYLKEDVESYLVFMLMRFTGEPNIASSVLGLEFLQEYVREPHHYQQLKDVGDKCLLVAGLFPGRAIKRRVKLSYFVKLGQMAYSTISHSLSIQEELFIKLCTEFPKLMDVLQAMRENGSQTFDLLQSLELWHETGSQAAWQRLREVSASLPLTPDLNDKSVH
ncbi:MAG: hypothetical protein JSR17_03710 [Proteobacteria bacterium]|nr:hypothetical protein [Pseudomonadota bacterium]